MTAHVPVRSYPRVINCPTHDDTHTTHLGRWCKTTSHDICGTCNSLWPCPTERVRRRRLLLEALAAEAWDAPPDRIINTRPKEDNTP